VAVIFNRLEVHSKLTLLAAVPILGILLLSWLVVTEVQTRAQAAAGLGSIEALAQLTERMLYVVHELREERAEVTYAAGLAAAELERGSMAGARRAEAARQYAETDAALVSLAGFLRDGDDARLPAKLRQDLKAAREQLRELPALRAQSSRGELPILNYLAFFAKANDALIGAMAGLTQLTNDMQLVLAIGHLVSAMQVIERESREHALLNYVFGKQDFPPGTYRYLVTLLTEEEVYTATIRTWSNEDDFARLEALLRGPRAKRIAEMRKIAMDTTEDTLEADLQDWNDSQRDNQATLSNLERDMAHAVRDIAAHKVEAARAAVHLALGLVLGVVAASTLLGWAITRGLTRSVRVLANAARSVQQNNDFSVRAEKTSSDELGLLTDAFNGMLAAIQERDRELGSHRKNLESLVAARTEQLSEKSRTMRLVLDNVEQGLALLDRDGKIVGESSRAFSEAFGDHPPDAPFHRVIAPDDERTGCALELGYEQLMADVLPEELALEQLPARFVREGRHFAVAFKPVPGPDGPAMTLLVTRDLSSELRAQRREAEQRERVRIFEQLIRDRIGYVRFLAEARLLLAQVRRAGTFSDPADRRALHTLKGLAATFEVSSLAEAAHELEHAIDQDRSLMPGALSRLEDVWGAFERLVDPVLGDERERRIELSRDELTQLRALVQRRGSHEQIEAAVARLALEPVARSLERLREQLLRLAQRLGKPEPRVVIEAGDLRLPAAELTELWSSLAHVVRNIVDHALESDDERQASGKGSPSVVTLRAGRDAAGLRLEIADDGRGIDWNKLRDKARQRGLPCATHEDLTRALFADGISTRDVATVTSGRGVGMSAVERAWAALGGTITVQSTRGRGTTFVFLLPPGAAADLGACNEGEHAERGPALDARTRTDEAAQPRAPA
jgi:two-component system chemotaxis sensor kinase CheA